MHPRMPGPTARTALRPLRSLGLPLAGPELAFAVAAQVSGTLTDRIAHMKVSDVWSKGFWTKALPQMACELYAEALGATPD